jgi:cbb3-type cytochrome oxidase subunit 3
MASTAVFVAIFAGVLVYLFATRKKAFTHQKELPFYDEQQENK